MTKTRTLAWGQCRRCLAVHANLVRCTCHVEQRLLTRLPALVLSLVARVGFVAVVCTLAGMIGWWLGGR